MSRSKRWSPNSWRSKPAAHEVRYPDGDAVSAAVERLRGLPPLVTSWEIERLRAHLAEAQAGERFLLQGGDCAETLADCRPDIITNKLKILLQMALVLTHGGGKPVIRVGRFAGQYAKPRSNPIETRDGLDGARAALPSYFGDLVNGSAFNAESRHPDPERMLSSYQHAAMTLNFVRALTEGEFADMHHPEYWELDFVDRSDLPEGLRDEYRRVCRQLGESLRFTEALSESRIEEVSRVEFFTSHEGLNLFYESAQTRRVPRRRGYYDLTTHLPWIGERTRAVDGAHVEFFRGIRNPVGVKLGPRSTPQQAVELAEHLNPRNDPGKLVFIVRMGADQVAEGLPPLIDALREAGRSVLWVSDPMHGNTTTTDSGIKTRRFDAILHELETSFEVHEACGSRLGGVHLELSGEHVTECLGGAARISESDLSSNYTSGCDPRLNYAQSLEIAFRVAKRMASVPDAPRGLRERSSSGGSGPKDTPEGRPRGLRKPRVAAGTGGH